MDPFSNYGRQPYPPGHTGREQPGAPGGQRGWPGQQGHGDNTGGMSPYHPQAGDSYTRQPREPYGHDRSGAYPPHRGGHEQAPISFGQGASPYPIVGYGGGHSSPSMPSEARHYGEGPPAHHGYGPPPQYGAPSTSGPSGRQPYGAQPSGGRAYGGQPYGAHAPAGYSMPQAPPSSSGGHAQIVPTERSHLPGLTAAFAQREHMTDWSTKPGRSLEQVMHSVKNRPAGKGPLFPGTIMYGGEPVGLMIAKPTSSGVKLKEAWIGKRGHSQEIMKATIAPVMSLARHYGAPHIDIKLHSRQQSVLSLIQSRGLKVRPLKQKNDYTTFRVAP